MLRAIVAQAQQGDEEAFGALVREVGDRCIFIAHRILRDANLAEDAVQVALVQVWRELPALRDLDRFDAWTYRVVVNACADAGRQRRRFSAEVRLLEPPATAADASAEAADRDQLERGFRHLRPEQRAARVLHYYVGLPAREVADVLGVPVGTAKSRIHYGTEIMRAALDRDDRPVLKHRPGSA